MNHKTARFIRYTVAGVMLIAGIVGLTVTEPVEGIGAPMPAETVAVTVYADGTYLA